MSQDARSAATSDLTADFTAYVMDKLNEGGITPDVLISLEDEAGRFVWVDIEGQQLWRITVEPARFA